MDGELQLETLDERKPTDVDPLLEKHEQPASSGLIESPSLIVIQDVENQDLEDGSVPCCRICLECDGEPGDCNCFGFMIIFPFQCSNLFEQCYARILVLD